VRRTGYDYEGVVRQILDRLRTELGLGPVRGNQKRHGDKTRWALDATSYRTKTGMLVVIESRFKSKRKVTQEEMAGFAYRVRDLGAEGLMVTTVDYQRGTQTIANAERLGMATLNPDATSQKYVLRIADALFAALGDVLRIGLKEQAVVARTCATCQGPLRKRPSRTTYFCPRCA
jgi:hypothetical protein